MVARLRSLRKKLPPPSPQSAAYQLTCWSHWQECYFERHELPLPISPAWAGAMQQHVVRAFDLVQTRLFHPDCREKPVSTVCVIVYILVSPFEPRL